MATADSPGVAFQLRCLGPVLLTAASGARVALRTSKQVALLLMLARHPGRAFSRDHLVELLWSEGAERKARHSLSQSVSLINKSFGMEAIVGAGANHVCLSQEMVWLDVTQFERLAADGRYEEARALWRGALLDGVWVPRAPNFQRWLGEERERLARILRHVSHELIEARRTEGDYQRMRLEAEKLLDLDGLDERAMLGCLEALALSGERTQALKRYREFERRLKEELDAEPGSKLRSWARRHRRGDGEPSPRAVIPLPRVSETMVLPAAQPLFGRVEEFELLWRSWEQAGTGKGAFIVLEGEAGIGKTALAGKLANQVHVGGGSVCFVKCYRTEKSVPFAPVSALIRQLSRLPGFVATSPSWIGEMTRLVPELRERFANVPQPLPGDDAARYRLCDAAVHAAEAVADENPLLVVVDDIQDADEASLALLHYLGRQAREQPLLLLTTTRSGQERTEFERTFFETARSASLARFVELRALPVAEAELLAERTLAQRGVPASQLLVRRIIVETRRNPLEVIEASIASSHDRTSSPDSDFPQSGHEQPAVDDFDRVVTERLRVLPPTPRLMGGALALAGRPLSDYELLSVTGLKPEDLVLATNILERAHVIRRVGARIGVAHERYAPCLVSVLQDDECRSLHLAIGDMLARSAQLDPSQHYEAATHYVATGKTREALSHARAAAKYAASVGAARSRKEALELLWHTQNGLTSALVSELGACYVELSELDNLRRLSAEWFAKRPRRTAAASRDLSLFEIAAGWRAGQTSLATAETLIQEVLFSAGRSFPHIETACLLLLRIADKTQHYDVVRSTARALRRLDARAHSRLRASALFATGYVFAKYYWPAKALPLFEQALARAKEELNWSLQLQVRDAVGVVLKQLGRYRQSVDAFEFALGLARRAMNPQGEVISLNNRAVSEMCLGDFDRVYETHAEADRIASVFPGWAYNQFRRYNEAVIRLYQDPEAARSAFRQAADDCLRSGLRILAADACAGMGLACQRLGDVDGLRRAAERMLELDPAVDNVSYDWIREAALAHYKVSSGDSPDEPVTRVETTARLLKRRDVSHWLALELELVLLREAIHGSRLTELRTSLADIADSFEAAAIASAARA